MEESCVVELAYASSQPYAMVIEPKNAVVTVMAMRRPHRPENIARLAILKFISVSVSTDRAVVLCLQIEHLCVVSLQFMILFVYLL